MPGPSADRAATTSRRGAELHETTAIWDVAGGLALVREAGGTVLQPHGDGAWQPSTTFGDLTQAHRWAVPLICGGRSAEQVGGHIGTPVAA
ncbi:inositol monophosphatase family protein [Actinoplanes utahensis]|uniref:inositol monophosphatase family protein n=1 Tax=Actinoplanes utahensis TaxID=1869 RepID=UPI0013781BF3|nr:inositol monophosphatase family protein [Actinoplanes utahensis]